MLSNKKREDKYLSFFIMVKNNLTEILNERFQTTIEKATNEQVYLALLEMTKKKEIILRQTTNFDSIEVEMI